MIGYVLSAASAKICFRQKCEIKLRKELLHCEKVKEAGILIKYKCTNCGYIYDPEMGDAPRIKPGTAFEDLSDDWVCPKCGGSKDITYFWSSQQKRKNK